MADKAQKFRLGIFLTIGFLIIIIATGIVAGTNLSEKRDIYYIKFNNESIKGLDVGGKVTYRGIGVGRVDVIDFSEDNIESILVTISVKHGTPIKEDCSCMLSPIGITGLNAIEITGGSNDSPLLKEKGIIIASSSLFGTISSKAVSITEQLDELIKSLNSLADDENRANISSIIADLRDLMKENKNNFAGTMTNLNSITADLSIVTGSLSTKVDTLMYDINSIASGINRFVNDESLNNIVTNIDTITTRMSSPQIANSIDNMNMTLERLHGLINNLDATVIKSKRQLNEILETTRETMENMNDFSKQISDRPSSLIIKD